MAIYRSLFVWASVFLLALPVVLWSRHRVAADDALAVVTDEASPAAPGEKAENGGQAAAVRVEGRPAAEPAAKQPAAAVAPAPAPLAADAPPDARPAPSASPAKKPDYKQADELAKLLLVPRTATWKYWDAEIPPGADWVQADFDDGAWASGAAPLGYGDAGNSTTISYGEDPDNKHPMAFFRLAFKVDKETASKPVVGHIMNDDAAIVYLNGKEIYRRNLPNGAVDGRFAVHNTKPEHRWWTFVPNEQLREGVNILAVRVHQVNAQSSDIIHAVELVASDEKTVTVAKALQRKEHLLFTGFDIGQKPVVAMNAEWKYSTELKVPVAWAEAGFDDSEWSSGAAPLGYGESPGNLTTEIKDKPSVIRLRHAFELSQAQAKTSLIGRVQFDDAAALYLNGKEIRRYLLPTGDLTGEVLAPATISDENHMWTFVCKPEQLKEGQNVIAISMHNAEGSGDMSTRLTLLPANDETVGLASKIQQMETDDSSGGSVFDFEPTLIAKKSEWYYWDKKDPPPKTWSQIDFDHTEWSHARGPLGYGDDFVATEIHSRDDNDQDGNSQAAYFRREFEADQLASLRGAVGRVMHDDAVIVYINGKEVYRRNLVADFEIEKDYTVGNEDNGYGTKEAVSGNQEQHYWSFAVPQQAIRPGKNVVAVRVQQSSQTSSDLVMDFEMVSVDHTQLIADARIQAREAIGDVQLAAVVAAVAQPAIGRASMTHLSDGESTYVINNQQVQVVNDALVQAAQYAPGAKFARAMEGDTLKKLAARENLDYDMLLILNRAQKNKTFKHREIYLQTWEYQVSKGETWSSLVELIGTTKEKLLALNKLDSDAKLTDGMKIQIPGRFQYRWHERNSYLQLAMYRNARARVTVPYDRKSVRNKIYRVKKGDTLESIAKKNKVSVDFLRVMNSLEPDEELGERLLIEYSVKVLKDRTLEDLLAVFRVEMDDLLAANSLKKSADMKPEQRVQIPYGKRMGLNRVASNPNSFVVYEVVLGSGKFEEAKNRRLQPPPDKEKPPGEAE